MMVEIVTGRRSRVTRRTLITGTALAAVSGPLLLTPGKAKAAERISLISWGGAYRKAIQTAFVEPFTKETGIEVQVADTPDLAKVKAQVSSGDIQWDVFDCPGAMALSGSSDGFWEKLDKNVIDTSDINVPVGDDYLPYYTYAGGVGFDPKRFPDGKHPTNFVQLWDVKGFPGRRGLRTRVSETLDIALLGDGVAPDKLYPLDVERGFKALDRIKPNIKNWIAETPQTIALVQNNEIDFSYTYSGRVWAAQKEGVSIDFSFAQTLNSLNYMCVLKGTPRKADAMKFMAMLVRPDRQAAFADILGYTPTVRKAVPLISADARKWMPDMANPGTVVMDDKWWQSNYAPLQKRFSEWLLV